MHIIEPDIKPAPEAPTVTVSVTVLPERTLAEIKVDMSMQPDSFTMAIELTRGVFNPLNSSRANDYLRDGGAQQIRTAMRQFQDIIGKLGL